MSVDIRGPSASAQAAKLHRARGRKDSGNALIGSAESHVAICCITFRRPEGLLRLLEGLNSQNFKKVPQPEITVVVVDNDRDAPMRSRIDAVRPSFRWHLIYECEAKVGLANARKRSLALVPHTADYVATVDDDEVPVASWLDELLMVSHRFDASIVVGPVKPNHPCEPPLWLVRGRFLELGPYVDGESMSFAYTGNSLIKAELILHDHLRFDPRFNHTGGEDQQFFGAAISLGATVVASENALVSEWVSPDRLGLTYLVRRRYRMGTTLSIADRLQARPFWRLTRLAKGLGRIGLGLFQFVAILPKGKVGLITAILNVARGSGSIVGITGIAYSEYSDATH